MRRVQLCSILLLASFVAACGGGGGGGDGGPVSPPPPAANNAPTATLLASGQVSASANSPDLLASVGARVSLSAGGSTDPDGDVLTFRWTITQRPAGSTLALASETTAVIEFAPDVLGTYALSVRVTDVRGAFADRAVTLVVDNTAPNPVVVVNATYQATPTTQPTQSVSIGSSIVLDASTSTDPDGDPIATTFTLLERPSGSSAALTLQAKTARFFADREGVYRVQAHGQDPGGAYFETIHVFDARNRAPTPVVITSATQVPNETGSTTLTASVGYTILLDGTGSSDAEGGVTRAWDLTGRPVGSAAQLSQTSGLATQFTVDVLGVYVVRLTVTDQNGASSYYTTRVNANNTRPVANVVSNATPVALPSGPTVRVPVNTELTLRATSSSDADGDPLTYDWTFDLRPPGSVAALTAPTAAVTRFTPDAGGNYILRLRVTDTAGAYSERTFDVAVGNYEPVAVLDKARATLLVGSSVSASAALSFDDDGDALTYAWDIDARPVGSTATIATPNAQNVTFTPDLPGLYSLSVTVSDGGGADVAYVIVRALSTLANSVNLPFAPLEMLYSKGLDVAVIVAANPNTLRIVDPYSGASRAVLLPAAVKSFKLSSDGRLAAVLHEGTVSLIELETATLVRSSATLGSQTDVFVLNDGVAYLIGQSMGQWVDEPIVAMNLRTGARITLPPYTRAGAYFYGTQRGVLADRKNRVLFMAWGLSPSDISWFTYNPGTYAVLGSGDTIYHGDYPLGADFYLSGNQDLIFTSAGTYFNTETLRYAGTLGGYILHMTHSSSSDEALVLQSGTTLNSPYTRTFLPQYRRFAGALLYEEASIPLPLVNGEQSYGLRIFHSANDDHVALVQTGSNEELAPGVAYHLIVR